MRVAKPDAQGKVTGEAIYAGDISDAEMLHAKVVFTDEVHARITSLDTSAAAATEGVHLVLTAADVPVNEYGLTKFDQPVLVGPHSTGRARGGGRRVPLGGRPSGGGRGRDRRDGSGRGSTDHR